MRRWFLLIAAALAMTGCARQSTPDDAKPVLTERQRDSIIARSDLPGSRVVGRALIQSDKAAARAVKMDSLIVP